MDRRRRAAADRGLRSRAGGDRYSPCQRRDRRVPAGRGGAAARPETYIRSLTGGHLMEYRQLGSSGLKVSALTLGTMTFGGEGSFVKVGNTDVQGARRQIDMCRDAGVTLIDTADVYSAGLSEEILGEALEGRRNDFLVATKVRFP